MRSVLCTLLIALAMPALGYDFGDRRLAPLEDPGIKARPLAGFAALESVDALPYVRASGREAYAKFLKSATPREGGGRHRQREFDAIERALERCNQRADGPCHLYAIDERVVWRGQ
jgi:hypothetical protein